MKPLVEEFRRTVFSSLPEDLPVSKQVLKDWKLIFESLTRCIKQRSDAETTFNTLIKVMMNQLKNSSSTFCPKERDIKNRHDLTITYKCYTQFHMYMTNLFLYLAMKDTELKMCDNITEFYIGLLKLLHQCDVTFLINLIDKLKHALNTILCSYMSTQMGSVEIEIGMCVIESPTYLAAPYVPNEALQPFTLHSKIEATHLVTLLSTLIFNAKDSLCGTQLQISSLRVLYKRFHAIELFGAKDINQFHMLDNLSISTNHELVPTLSHLVQKISDKVSEPQDNEWRQIEIQVLNVLTKPFPSKYLQRSQILRLITDIILRRLMAHNFEERTMKAYLTVFAKLMRISPSAVMISDKHVKWLAQKFCGDAAQVYLTLLMLYMEAELRTVLPYLLAREKIAPSVKSSKESRSFRHKWYKAEEYSIVWQILKSLFYRILSRLETQAENVTTTKLVPGVTENHSLDLMKLNLILRGITVTCCKIEDTQKKQVVLINFSFFQTDLEKVVQQISVLPIFCTQNAEEHKMWQLFLELVNFIRYLTEFSYLDQRCIDILEAVAGMLWLRGDRETQPQLAEGQRQQLLLHADKLASQLGDWRNKSFPCDENHVPSLIIQLFFNEFHQIRGPISRWHAQILQESLHINSTKLCIAAIKCTPLVLCSCNRDDIDIIVESFQRLRNHDDSEVAIALAQTVPVVVCILAGWCCSFKVVTEEPEANYYKDKVRIQISCYDCDNTAPPISQSWTMLHKLEGFTENWKGLIEHNDKVVRLSMAQGFKRIGLHLRTSFSSTDIHTWMKLLSDEDSEVGSAFVPCIPLLFHDIDLNSPVAVKIFEIVFSELQAAITKCITNNSVQHWRLVVEAIAIVSKIHLPFAAVPLVKLYSLLLVLSNEKCYFINQTIITRLADVYETTSKAMFWLSFDDICQITVDALEVIEPREVNIITCLNRLSCAFSVEERIFKKQLHILVYVLIPKCIVDARMEMYICQIAKYLDANVKAMLSAWFPLIYPKLLMDHNEYTANKCVLYLLKKMETEESKVIRSCEPFIISSLAAQFASKTSKVLRIINRIKDLTNTDDIILIESNSELDPKDILQPYLHGILVSLQSKIMQKYIREDVKIEAMNSLGKLLTFMGLIYIEPYLNKILDMLCIFAQFKQPNIIKAYCQLVLDFAKCLRLKKYLAGMAHIIVSNLVQIDWDLYSEDLQPILNFFICNSATRNTLKPMAYIGPMLKHFNYEQHITRMNKYQEEQTIEALFTHISKTIQSPRERSQFLAVLELKSSIVTKQTDLQHLLLHDNKDFNPLKEVYGKLINVCASGNPEIRMASVDCLGKIGAINPKNWVTAYGFNFDYRFCLDSLSPDFIIGSFELLVDELQSASNCTDMDVIAFVCQELMKAHDFQDEPMKAPTEIWSVLSDSAQLMLVPFFKSSYKSHKPMSDKQLPHPIFGSKLGKTFQSWLFHWVCRLIKFIRDEQAKRVFTAMKYLFKINSKCLFFFLPHIFLHALWSSTSSEKRKIFEEMVIAGRFSLKDSQKKVDEQNWNPSDIIKSTLASTPSLHSLSSIDVTNEKTSLLVSSSQVIFYLVDYMYQWCYRFLRARVSEQKSKLIHRSSLLDSQNQNPKLKPSKFNDMNERHDIIKSALDSLDLIALAESCHLCNNNYRALRYIEMHVINNKKILQQHLGLILRIYTQIGDSDGVWGIVSCISEQPTSVEQILNDEMNGHFDKAIPGYESLQQQNHLSPEIIQNMAKSYLGLEVYHSAIALIERHCNIPNLEARDMMLSVKLEILWRMEDWQQLKNTLQNCCSEKNTRPTWATYLARIIVYMNSKDLCNAHKTISDCRNELGLWLHNSNFRSAAYAQNYFIFLMMHLISDIEDVIKFLELHHEGKTSSEDLTLAFNQMFKNMEMKQERTSLHWQCGQQLFAMRRTMLKICLNILEDDMPAIGLSAREKIAELWLNSAYLALSYRQFLQAITYSRKAEEVGERKAFVVMAQAEWESGNQDHAIAILKRGLRTYYPREDLFRAMPENEMKEARLNCAKAKLLLAEYSTDMKITDVLNSVRLYKEALNVYLFWEDSWVEAARAWQKLDINIHQVFADEKSLGILKEIVRAYSNALVCGIKYIYESLPAIIAIWANAGLACHQANTSEEHRMGSKEKGVLFSFFKLFSDTMRKLYMDLPAYAYYIAMPHLQARLCHPYSPVYDFIKEILISVLYAYPAQTLWKLVPTLQIPHALRKYRINDVLDGLQRRHPQLVESTQNYVVFVNLLYHFGFADHSKSQYTYKVEPRFQSFFKKSPRILMPLNEMMTVVLPPKGDYKRNPNHSPFPSNALYITGLGQEFEVIQSLQKPKRFSLLASDGNEYDWLIKVKDDLRLDGLVMDFMSVMNDLLKNDPPCKQRGLKCKPYSVVPIGEDCGLIEWVPDLVPLRDTIFSIYQLLGRKTHVKKEIKKEQNSEQKQEIFEKYWIPAHPPVLDYWFSLQFYREDAWYEASRQYVNSTAVMSMIGYILGLGDRHGGNLMLSVATGELMHVDFNCLFNKGERLPWPERVPFRLTQNMISAMGATGLEGAFLRVCELTLDVIKRNIGTLISVIHPIVFDVSRKDNLAKQKESNEEFINKRMLANIDRVILRMSGYINDRDMNHMNNKAYSPQGHARALIKMARDPKNLSQMYPGWGAFM